MNNDNLIVVPGNDDMGTNNIQHSQPPSLHKRKYKGLYSGLELMMTNWFKETFLKGFKADFTRTIPAQYYGFYPFCAGFYPSPYVQEQLKRYLEG